MGNHKEEHKMKKPNLNRKVNVSDDKKMVETVSTIKERFSMKEFKAVLENKKKGLQQLKNQKKGLLAQIQDGPKKDSSNLQKAKRLFGEAKLKRIIQEFMNRESQKQRKKQLEQLENEEKIMEKDIKDFEKVIKDGK